MPEALAVFPDLQVDATLARALARALGGRLIETHISWVILAGDYAWKIKKPVRPDFLDYSTLETRRHFCEEEVRLNRRLAPSLYLGVSRITGQAHTPVLGDKGAAIEYAVRMRRFPDGALYSERLAAGLLTAQEIDAAAGLLAEFHRRADRAAPQGSFGSPAGRRDRAMAALKGVQPLATPEEYDALQAWLIAQAEALEPLWARRQQDGMVRECHGDLHLANLVWLDDRPVAFDCIEFDPALRWIDVLDDIAFPVMDLCARHRADFAFRLLNAWLDLIGDHAGLPALRFAVVYRALVRAHVERLRGASGNAAARDYLETAIGWTRPGQPSLCITHGLPGSGKTFESQRLLEQRGAIRLRSDVERKRLFGLGMLDDSRARGLDIYTADATRRTYDQLFALARIALLAGYPVVLDAAFLQSAERDQAAALARELGVEFSILACQAPPEVLRERLLARTGDASEADLAVLERLQATQESLS